MKNWLFFLLLFSVCYVSGQRIGDTGVAADTIFWEAVYLMQSDPDSAIYYFEQAAQEYSILENVKRENLCYQGIAASYHATGQFGKEEKYFEQAYELIEAYVDKYPEYYASATYNLGSFYLFYGNFQKANILLEDALITLRDVVSYEDSSSFFNNLFLIHEQLGTARMESGDYQNAIDIYHLADEVIQNKLSLSDYQIVNHINNIGTCYFFLQDYSKAKFYYSKSIRKIRWGLQEDNIQTYNSYQNLALTYVRDNQLDSARALLNEIDHLPKDDTLVVYFPASIHQIKGEYYLKQDSLTYALQEFKDQLHWRTKEYQGYDKRIDLFIQSHHQLAETYQKLGFSDSALFIYKAALKYLDINKADLSTPYPLLGVPLLDGKAQAHLSHFKNTQQTKHLDTAFWCYLIADSLIDQARNYLQTEDSKLFFAQKSRPIYERAIRFCIMMHDHTSGQAYTESAFYFSERNKATLLLQSIQDAGAKLVTGLPDSVLQQERNLKADIAFYKNKIFELQLIQPKTDSSQLNNLRQVLFDKEEAHRILVQQLEINYPAYYNLKYDQTIVPVSEIQSNLSPGQLLVEFFEGDSNIYVFTIDDQSLKVHEYSRSAFHDSLIQTLISSLRQPQRGLGGLKSFAEPAYVLYQQLLSPTLSKYTKLVIIPDGQLTYLPFELLLEKPVDLTGLDDRKADRAYRHLAYLFKEKNIRYAYSASLLLSKLHTPKTAKHDMAAFAPAYMGQWFLANNQSQAEHIASILDGEAFTGPQASKSDFMTLASNYRILHLAMHAEPDLYSPLRARLIFAGKDAEQIESLYAYELYNLNLNAKLAVLAACESGHGKLQKSEGIYSLSRAFRYTGCPSVVSSFWKADGEATTRLMEIFYEQLSKGMRISESLQIAKKEFLVSAKNAQLHPYYWGNFILIGPDDPVKNSWLGLKIVFGLILLVIVGVIGFSFPKT